MTNPSLYIGTFALILLGWLVIKGYNTKGSLFSLGILLLICAQFVPSAKPILKEASGNAIADISNYVYSLFEQRGGGLGMIIMLLIGFSAYMSHVGANDEVIRVLSKVLHRVRSPYVLMIGTFMLSTIMSVGIQSATALGIFMMATFFPLMVRLGISVPSAAAICASGTLVGLIPITPVVMLAAEKAHTELMPLAFQVVMPLSVTTLIMVSITHFLWQRWCDKQEGLSQIRPQEIATDLKAHELQRNVPRFYILLPFLPIIGLFLFNGKLTAEIKLGGLVVLTMILTALLESLRRRNMQEVYAGLEVCYQGMAEAFSNVVVLLVAAGIFAHGLSTVGFVSALIGLVQTAGAAATILMLLLVSITLLVSLAIGSGNAAFFAFVELAPRLAEQLGISAIYLIVPMMQVSDVGRVMSPVSGVVVAVSGAAKLSPLLLVKRTAVPALVAAITIVVYSILFIPQ